MVSKCAMSSKLPAIASYTLYSAKYAAAIVEKGEPTDYVLMPTLTWDVDEGKSALLNLAEWFEDIAEGGVS